MVLRLRLDLVSTVVQAAPQPGSSGQTHLRLGHLLSWLRPFPWVRKLEAGYKAAVEPEPR